MEVKEFNPANIATALGIDDGIIYAHLSLHDGIPLEWLPIILRSCIVNLIMQLIIILM